jgi:hypothetical protein
MTSETAQKARDCTVDPVVLKLEEFLPYRLNVCASLISHALSRIYAERYKIGNPEWRVLVTLGQFGAMTAKPIGTRSHMRKKKVSRAVALLEGRKLIARVPTEPTCGKLSCPIPQRVAESTDKLRRLRSSLHAIC